MHHPTDRITHTTAFVTRVVEHWLEREIVYVYIYSFIVATLVVGMLCMNWHTFYSYANENIP